MKTLLSIPCLAVALLLAVVPVHTFAAAAMRLSADGGVTWTTVIDNDAEDSNTAPGIVTFSGNGV